MKYKFLSRLVVLSVLLTLIFSAVGTASARVIGKCYVNDDASGANTGASWTDAYTSLQSALADTCTEIWVAAGIYKPGALRTNTFQLENGVTIYGGFDGVDDAALADRNPAVNVTVLSGDIDSNDSQTPIITDLNTVTGNTANSYSVVRGANNATLDGFTITAAYRDFDDGSCGSGCGGGMHNSNSSPTLKNISFRGNLALSGGAMSNSGGSPTLTNVTFSGNKSAWHGGAIYNWGSSPTLTNVTFVDNSTPGYGGGIINNGTSNSTLINVTFSGNSGGTGGGIYNMSNSSLTLQNVIIANSTSGGDCHGSVNAVSANNLIEATGTNACGLTNGTNGNIIGSDPLLGALGNNGGFTQTIPLQPGSPAINMGNTATCSATDQRGQPRIGPCDIGAYETQTILLAAPAGKTYGLCQSWEDACELSYALPLAASGQEIWVKAGVYKPTGGTDRAATFQLKDGVAVYGGFAGTETARDQRGLAANVTILSGDIDNNDINTDGNNVNETYADISGNNSYHVVRGASGATLDGFIVTGGKANGALPDNLGGGMFNWPDSNPIITNVTFIGNSALTGGGMANNWYSSPTLTNVTFSGNSAIYGGGMANDTSSPTLTNVTFSGNAGTTAGGGMSNQASSPTLKNVIIANSIGSGDCSGSLNPASANNLIESTGSFACGLTNGTNGNIIGSDPLLGALGNYGGFTPTFPLLPGSPAIDAGNATACTTGSDQRGVSYVGTCDIGAFESQGFTLVITGGNNQSVPPNAPFPAPLIVSVTANAALEPVNGGKVTFTPPASGASAVITGSSATITDGAASVDATANGTTGSYTVTASTRGADDVNFSLANQETPVITWSNPADIVYGTTLSVTQLNATANVPGTFTYTPDTGTVLNAGSHTLHVDFVPTDTVNYANASKDVSITVTQAAPVITWSNPANIVYGTALSATQLNATANVPGAFTYTPALGTVLNVGTHTLHVDFVPTDTVNYTNAAKDVSITVTKAAPVITWGNPANIVYGTALSATQLNATANVPGAFTYTPALGTVLNAGTHTLHVDFTPTDTVNYANAAKDVSITVTKATPVITWSNPANIVYGTALSGTQLNAAANTPGTFTYTPASGTVLNIGTHTLHVDFVPTDTVNFTNASKDVSITVTKAAPVITWANPANIVYGTPLSGTQLNASASTPGTFTYNPASGTVLNAGTHTLHVDFTPTDTVNYTNASKDVSITVTKAAPVITWANPADIDQGTPLSDTQLNATANVPGTFTYTPAAGATLSTGTHTLHVDFVPTDTVNYANASADVSITVIDHVLFADVPDGYWARLHIERLYLNQITGGCANNPLRYCPTTNVNRAMMAVFVLRAAHGPDFTPPAATGTVFADVPADGFAAAWIEQLAAEGITGGCGGGNYCPTKSVTRAQMAVFLVKAMYGTDYTPPTATGTIFGDVPADGFAAAFIEQLVADGITGGCGGGNFCPNKYITRAEMAVFLVAAFNLP
ncbi:MAG: S-layer homology domain-containing protein [Chloroflexi bacterium]|nr:S-layer homology domain-containing protein [Chloroflexota bacterium]